MAGNTVTLTSIAMLKVNFDTGSRDYIDYLVPFVAHVLVTKPPDPITDHAVAAELTAEFGIRIPSRGVQLVLRRMARRGDLAKSHGVFRPRKPISAPDIRVRRAEATRCIQDVTARLADFAKERCGTVWSEDQASHVLIIFLSSFSVDCLRTYIFGTALPAVSKGNTSDMYLVSAFIENAYQVEPTLFEEIITVVKGQMLANALICPDLESMQKKFGGVTFYLDTPLVLRTLGFHDRPELHAMVELLRLLQQLGGVTAVFEHTVEETNRVIKYCEENIEQPDARGRIIYEMRQQGRTRSDIALMRSRLHAQLASHRLVRHRTPDYTKAYQIDESVLQDSLDEDIGYANPRALQYDVNSIRSIYTLRRGYAPVRLEDSVAVLVTSNSALAKAAYEYGKNHESSREVSSVITNYSLANIAWLKAPLGAPGLPKCELLAMCYAAMEPAEHLWKRYIVEIDKLKMDGKVSPNDHAALRYSLRARDELMNLTLGEEEALTVRTVSQILEQVKSEYVTEQAKAVAAEREAHAITRRSRDDLLETQSRTGSRLFWVADAVSRWVARIVFLIGAFLLLVGLSSSPLLTSRYVQGSYWITALVNSLFGISILWGLLNWCFGISLTTVSRHIKNWTRPWAYRQLVKAFLDEETMLEPAEAPAEEKSG